ncbi:bifunctional diaminohydroxyphosphoribosylaminopyrimidine deaminase/5-amino-6-(5-phosphoribosylamino)uracil reductase RibD [Thiohalomonas denitrificans]|uniref:bifunctional diaminohydroxyphosphoribosylaminopyrimidine deaminase/5-amino-6-(5-phosphoribosylamino)uracil reductase RibD n=1 Tax=Thiohalomonas denitrificans TaxID=415747 RepID=UPI00294FFB85|nr:bifunctional diaminohydroxyphosphoribosylaminopyrimidine deaminase/5-amino-6-(5-phosphoribosylamino)uracil reductase RibD [Thiohalomonas denitrificans]
MTEEDKEYYMALALEESAKSLPACRPNPPVGCVFVRNHEVVAKAYTQPPGHEHAEAMALRLYGKSLEDVSAFVTLEPCSFQGRTPSCALALVAKGAKKVFVSVLDPHPGNRGEGIRVLRAAGVRVETGILKERVMSFIDPYLTYS